MIDNWKHPLDHIQIRNDIFDGVDKENVVKKLYSKVQIRIKELSVDCSSSSSN